MYEIFDDTYCYAGTSVLKNRANLTIQSELSKFETFAVAKRSDEAIPAGNLSYSHYLVIHKHLFQDVYDWAGKIRTVRMSKGGSAFCFPEHIEKMMVALFNQLDADNYFRDLTSEEFAKGAAHFLSELNAIHPFREGNGRTQNIFLIILADRAGHPLDFERLHPPDMMQAMIEGFHTDEKALKDLIVQLMRGG